MSLESSKCCYQELLRKHPAFNRVAQLFLLLFSAKKVETQGVERSVC